MTQITLEAHAKLNLTLEVLGRRSDGYHDIASIFQTIDLHDTLQMKPAEGLTIESDRGDIAPEDNLVMKAARLLRERAGTDAGARMTLRKKIPVSAGLGGGSSDAAAALLGLNRLWDLGMSVDELTPVATAVGSDVPYFLHGGTAMVLGRGERVRRIPPADLEWLVLLAPDINVESKTASLYGRLTDADFTRGALTRKLEARISGGGDVPPQFLFNAFDNVAFDAFPGLEEYWNALRSLGAREIHLAGSGPAMFAPVSRREFGTAIQLMLESRHGWNAFLVTPWQPPDAP